MNKLTGKKIFELEIKCRKKAISMMKNAKTIKWSELLPEIKQSYNLMAIALKELGE